MEHLQPRSYHELEIWTEVTLGLRRAPEEYRQASRETGLSISDWGNTVLDQISCSQERTGLQLVRVQVLSLGYFMGAPYSRICEKAAELGLRLCPAEVGPALHLRYPGAYYPKWTLIAMEPVVDTGGAESIFRINGPSCCRGPELACFLGDPEVFHDKEAFFIFAL